MVAVSLRSSTYSGTCHTPHADVADVGAVHHTDTYSVRATPAPGIPRFDIPEDPAASKAPRLIVAGTPATGEADHLGLA